MTQWIGIAITCAVYLVGGGVFVGVVRVSINALTKTLDKLEKRMDGFDGQTLKGADHEARLKTLEREMKEVRDLRDLVIKRGERQDLQHEASEKSLKALEERVAAAIAMIANAARREGKIP